MEIAARSIIVSITSGCRSRQLTSIRVGQAKFLEGTAILHQRRFGVPQGQLLVAEHDQHVMGEARTRRATRLRQGRLGVLRVRLRLEGFLT